MKKIKLVLVIFGLALTAMPHTLTPQANTFPQHQEFLNWLTWVANEAHHWLPQYPFHPEWFKGKNLFYGAVAEEGNLWQEVLNRGNGCVANVLRQKMGTTFENPLNQSMPAISDFYVYVFDGNRNILDWGSKLWAFSQAYPDGIRNISICVANKIKARTGLKGYTEITGT